MTTRDIQGHLEELYGVEVSPTLISTSPDAVLDEVRAWQNRPLDAVYRSCTWTLVVKMREQEVENGLCTSHWHRHARAQRSAGLWTLVPVGQSWRPSVFSFSSFEAASCRPHLRLAARR